MPLTALLLSLAPCLPAAGEPSAERGIPWFEGTWEELLAEARQSDRVIFVDFWAEWCRPCKKMLSHTLPDEQVLAELGELVCYSVDIDSALGRPLTREFKVKSYPTLLFLDPNGSPRDRLTGYFGPEEFLSELQRIRRNEGTLGALRQDVQRNPESIDARFELALKLRSMGDVAGFEKEAQVIRRLDPQQLSLPARKLELEIVVSSLRQTMELGPLYEFLEDERYEENLFQGWYEVWKYEGSAFKNAEDPARRKKHRKAWSRAAHRLWKHVPEGKIARYGNYIAWSFYEHAEALSAAEKSFALEVALRAAGQAPRDAAVIDTLACCLFMNGEREKALAEVLRCMALDPENEQWQKRHRTFSRH